jgi:antitoxin PrlF
MDFIARMTTRGRVTLPKAFRDTMKIEPGDRVVFHVEGPEVVLERVPPGGEPFAAAEAPPPTRLAP